MDATGYSTFSALPLFPLAGLFWFLQKLSREEMGLAWGTATDLWPGPGLPSVCHAVWNGIDYPLYGFGEKIGALGIEETHIYGPEVGMLGIGLNFLFATVLWYWTTRFDTKSVVSQPITAGSERC